MVKITSEMFERFRACSKERSHDERRTCELVVANEMGISSTLIKQMTKENLITRQNLWDFLQTHKNESKDDFGGWLIGQEVTRTDNVIMAVDLWNDVVEGK